MNESPPWLSHHVIQCILHKLLDMTDKMSIEQRTRLPSFRVNAKTLPELFDTEAVGETEYAWELITEMERQGWITLKRGKSRLGYADYENNPYFIWFKVDYELGLDWALISLIFMIGVTEVSISAT
jgi:hypothetical protein